MTDNTQKLNKVQKIRKVTGKFRARINRALGNPISRKKQLKRLLIISTIAVSIATVIQFKEPISSQLFLYIAKLKARIYKLREVLSSSNSETINNRASYHQKSMSIVVLIYSIGVAAAIVNAYLSKDST